jgi:hypothetical protein
MINYLAQILPSISANFHSGTEVVNYPFDTWEFLHADNDWFRLISSEYADLAISKFPGYMSNFRGGITNGYQWYEVNGGRQDYVTYFLRGRETTIELSRVKLLPEEEINTYWEANRESMINYLRQGLYGFHGNVRDSISGEAIKAEIELAGHDIYNSSIFSDSASGNFYRFVKAGTYTLRVSADNYIPEIIDNISIEDYQRKNINISLLPDSFIPDELQIKLGPNPFVTDLTLYLKLNAPASISIKIYDLYGMIRSSRIYSRPEGFHNITISPEISPGLYILELKINEVKKKYKIIKAR